MVNQKLRIGGNMQNAMQILRQFRFSCIGLLALATLAIVYSAAPASARETYVQLANRLLAHPPTGAVVRADLETIVLKATNNYRATLKLPPLKLGTVVLQHGAEAQAMDLLVQQGMGHVSSGGQNFESRMRALNQGQMFLAAMAENAARVRNSSLSDAQKAQALVTQWIKSSGHRKNLTNRTYVSVAIGVVTRGDDVYAVQIFSGPEVKTNIGVNIQQ
jgi:uncharacterized protein YkwD